jgi:hypothetical protein
MVGSRGTDYLLYRCVRVGRQTGVTVATSRMRPYCNRSRVAPGGGEPALHASVGAVGTEAAASSAPRRCEIGTYVEPGRASSTYGMSSEGVYGESSAPLVSEAANALSTRSTGATATRILERTD